MNKELKMYYNGNDWVIAYDAEDAWNIWTRFLGEEREDYDNGEHVWKEFPKDEVLSVYDEDEKETEEGTVQYFIEEYGRGYLMSTEF